MSRLHEIEQDFGEKTRLKYSGHHPLAFCISFLSASRLSARAEAGRVEEATALVHLSPLAHATREVSAHVAATKAAKARARPAVYCALVISLAEWRRPAFLFSF